MTVGARRAVHQRHVWCCCLVGRRAFGTVRRGARNDRQRVLSGGERSLDLGRHDADLVRLLRRHVAAGEPAEHVVDDGLRHRYVAVLGAAHGLEAHVAEVAHQVLDRYAVLQGVGDRAAEGFGEATDGRALLGHREEDLAGRAVLVEADGDVAVVALDAELVRDGRPGVRHLAADRPGLGGLGGFLRLP